MAFTSEQLIAEAKNRIGENSSISDRTLSDFFSNPMFTPQGDADPDDDYWKRSIETLKWFDKNYTGQHNHAMSEAHTLWEEQYKKEHPAPEPKPEEKPEPKPEEKPVEQITPEVIARIVAETLSKQQKQTDPAIEQMQKQLNEWKEQREAEAAQETISNLYAQARAKILEGCDLDMACFEDAVEYLQNKGSIKKDTPLDVAEKMLREQYEKRYAKHNPGGDTPYGITVGGGSGQDSYAMRFYKDRQKSEEAQRKTVDAQRQRFK